MEGRKEALALENEILRGVVGSSAHGTAIEGQDDRDEMGICVEPQEYVCGLSHFEQYIYRTQPEGVRSGPGDLDLIIYSLRKFCRLAAHGNPSILLLLWLPKYIKKSYAGQRLVDIREAFVSAESGKRFLGYLVSQKKALKGERTKKVSRPDLVEKYGYDTKFAMHALRLGFQGVEYLTEGRISVPVQEPELSTLRAVRGGEVGFQEAIRLIELQEKRLIEAIDNSSRVADLKAINAYLIDAHEYQWSVRPIQGYRRQG